MKNGVNGVTQHHRSGPLRRRSSRPIPRAHVNSGISDGGVKRRHGGKLPLLSLGDLDARCRGAKAANQLRAELISDLGGEANISAAQREIVTHAAIVGAILGDVEAGWLVGVRTKVADLATMGMLIDRQRRLLECLGLHNGRRPKDVTPVQSLNQYLNQEATE